VLLLVDDLVLLLGLLLVGSLLLAFNAHLLENTLKLLVFELLLLLFAQLFDGHFDLLLDFLDGLHFLLGLLLALIVAVAVFLDGLGHNQVGDLDLGHNKVAVEVADAFNGGAIVLLGCRLLLLFLHLLRGLKHLVVGLGGRR